MSKEKIVVKLGKNRKVTHTVESITADNVRELRKFDMDFNSDNIINSLDLFILIPAYILFLTIFYKSVIKKVL